MTFSVPKQKGDLLKSEDWNALTAEVERLGKEKLDRNKDYDTFKGSLTVEGALNIKPKADAQKAELSITGSLSVSQSLAVGDFLTIDSQKKSLTINGVEINRFYNQGSLNDDNKSIPTQNVIKKHIDDLTQSKADKGGSSSQDFQTKTLTVNEKISLSEKKEIFFKDNGQIRSLDDNHRIIFDRSNDKLQLIEAGEIQLISGYDMNNTSKNTPKLVVQKDGKVTANLFEGVGAFVVGMIIMWFGDENKIPKGWALCNGQYGTPDLTGRFIMGAGNGVNPKQQGDPDSHSHAINAPAQTFTTSKEGNHSHYFPQQWYTNQMDSGSNRSGLDTGGTEARGATTQSNGEHSHSVTITYDKIHTQPYSGENRPKWYALCFIMYKGN